MTNTLLAENEARIESVTSVGVGAGPPATFKNVLVGVDGTSAGRDAIALAEMLRDADGRLTLAHVVLVPQPVYGDFFSSGAGKHAREILEREQDATGVSAELAGMFAPAVGGGLQQLARDACADLLVVGSSSRRPIARLLRGGNTRSAVIGAPCAVAVAPRGYAQWPNPIGTIGVAYDGSPESEIALVSARVLAEHHGAVLRAVTAVWPTSAIAPPASRLPLAGARWAMMLEGYEQEAIERVRALTGTDGRVIVGPPLDGLRAFGDEVDLLVVGSRGHGPLRRLLLGSTSAYLTRTAQSPVLVVPRGHVRPRPHRADE